MKLLLAAFALVLCQAQSPAFEVASVKLSPPGEKTQVRPEHGRLTALNMTLRGLVRYAYDVRDVQIAGGPSWFDSDGWDIVATAGRDVGDDERKKMLQSLLTERFRMTIRRETKDLPVYALVVAKSGLKMKTNSDGSPMRVQMNVSGTGFSRLIGQNVPLTRIVMVLAGPTGRIVLDRTGIEGNFDFQLEWVPDAAHMPMINGARPEGGTEGPSIFTATQEQLGLRLEATKGPVEILVIERAEKATEN